MSETEPNSSEKNTTVKTKITFAEYLAYRAARDSLARKNPDETGPSEPYINQKEKKTIKQYGGAAYVRAQETGTYIDDLVDIGDSVDAIE